MAWTWMAWMAWIAWIAWDGNSCDTSNHHLLARFLRDAEEEEAEERRSRRRRPTKMKGARESAIEEYRGRTRGENHGWQARRKTTIADD